MEMPNANNSNSDLSGSFRPTAGIRVFLIGFMGCGKSYWGRQLAEKIRVPFIDLDEKIEENEERPITEIFATEGEEYFRQKEKEVLTLLTETHETFVMSTGGGTPCFFNNIDYMNKTGTTIWINCTPETLLERLKNEREKRPLIRDLDDEQLKSYIIRKVGDRKIFYQQAEIIIYEEEQILDNFLGQLFETENNN